MKYYAVLDTNVLVSALLKNGSIPGRVISEALNGDIIPVLNDEIIAEYEDVLNCPKFHFDKKTVKVLLDELKKRGVYSDYGLIEDEITDPKDVVFYAVLMEKNIIIYVMRFIPRATAVLYLTDSLNGILKGRMDIDRVREEKLREKI